MTPQTERPLTKEDVGLLRKGDVLLLPTGAYGRLQAIDGDLLMFDEAEDEAFIASVCTFVRRDDSLEAVAADIRALCTGHPHAKIAWPHRELHALADRLAAFRIPSLAKPDAPAGTGDQLYTVGGRVFRHVLEPDAPAGDVGEAETWIKRALLYLEAAVEAGEISFEGLDENPSDLALDGYALFGLDATNAGPESLKSAALQAQPRTGAGECEKSGGFCQRCGYRACMAAPSTLSQGTDAGLIERLNAVREVWSEKKGCLTKKRRNPDGPDAAREIATLRGEVERLTRAVAYAEEAARRYARCYPEGSDGRNTFLLLADQIASRRARTASADLVKMKGRSDD